MWLPVSSHFANIVQQNAFRGQSTKYKCLESQGCGSEVEEDSLQIQCKSIMCTTPFPIPLSLPVSIYGPDHRTKTLRADDRFPPNRSSSNSKYVQNSLNPLLRHRTQNTRNNITSLIVLTMADLKSQTGVTDDEIIVG